MFVCWPYISSSFFGVKMHHDLDWSWIVRQGRRSKVKVKWLQIEFDLQIFQGNSCEIKAKVQGQGQMFGAKLVVKRLLLAKR